jgi:hypothetical protein
MRLVIVESPTKAKTLQKFLGDGYEVLSSKGHVIDLPKKNLGVDVEHDFTPEYEQVPGKKTVIDELKKSAAKAEEIFLATDQARHFSRNHRRSGEAIVSRAAENRSTARGFPTGSAGFGSVGRLQTFSPSLEEGAVRSLRGEGAVGRGAAGGGSGKGTAGFSSRRVLGSSREVARCG